MSVLRIVFGIAFRFPLKGASKKSIAIPAVLFAIAMIVVCPWAVAQEGSISGSPDRSSALNVAEVSDGSSSESADVVTRQGAGLRYRPRQAKPALSWETGAGKSYLIPAVEIPGFILGLNAYNRLAFHDEIEDGKRVYSSNFSTFWNHLIHGPWRYDRDGFHMNQMGHPYQGSIYDGFARSAGLDFWESLGYTFVGSFLWETAGETTNPSINDQVASGIAGSFFGESLFRMASLLLEEGGGKPGFWRELGTAVLSPPTGFNRLVFGDRFKSVFPSRNPAIFQWVQLGEGVIVNKRTGSNINNRTQTSLSYSISYGLPGEPGYDYKRPFDYFQFDLGVIGFSHDDYVNFTTQGSLFAKKYELGNSYRGVWGLYGSFDYASPRTFHVSGTTASLGTTYQWWLAPAVALQGTVLGGIGLAAGSEIPRTGDRDYHYGAAGRGQLALRLIFGDLAMVDMMGRGHYISSLGGSTPRGSETISNLEAGLKFRIYGHHAVGVQYAMLRRDSHYPGLLDAHQMLGTFSLLYTLLGDTRFGAVEWRNDDSRGSEKRI